VPPSSPAQIRSILSGISRPGAAPGTVWGSSGSAQLVEGAVKLAAVEDALPEIVARAEHTRVPFTVLLARPGPSAAAGSPVPVPRAAEVDDLAAALSVSLSPMQDLYDAGRGHLAVIVPGRSGASQREAMRLTRRAAAEGAPLFTWAAARFPRDASTAAGLLEVASNRLDGRLVSRTDAAAARTPERGTGRYGAAIWAGVGAAVLMGAVAFALHGSGSGPQSAAGMLSDGQPGTSASGGQASGSTGSGGSGSNSGSGSSSAGHTSGGAGSTGGNSGSGTSSSGLNAATGGASSGTGSGPTSTQGTPQSGTGQNLLSTATTLPGSVLGTVGGLTGGGTGSLTGGGTGSSGTGSSGTGTSGTGTSGTGTTGTGTTGTGTTGGTGSTSGSGGTTTTTAPPTTTTTVPSSQCTGLVNTLTCTANNLLGGLGL
jgi:hypothetical protein